MKGVVEDSVMDVVVSPFVGYVSCVNAINYYCFFVIFVDLDLEISHGKNVLISGCTGKN